jgi:hypothetical protein
MNNGMFHRAAQPHPSAGRHNNGIVISHLGIPGCGDRARALDTVIDCEHHGRLAISASPIR